MTDVEVDFPLLSGSDILQWIKTEIPKMKKYQIIASIVKKFKLNLK